jgi:hypothetical protein
MAGRVLVERGHQVVLHARDERRADDARTALSVPPFEHVVEREAPVRAAHVLTANALIGILPGRLNLIAA